MRVKVQLMPQQKELQDILLDNDATGQDLLNKLELAPDAHILTKDGSPIPLDEELSDGDNIKIIKVVSGG